MRDDDTDWKDAAKAVPELRWLKTLVTGLTLVMGLGMIAVVAMLWMRLQEPSLPALPETIALPDGATADAVTFARDWIVVVTDAGEVLLFDRDGALRDRVRP
ncbi:DUF6476 family protein [Paracoccus sp. 1_MG-2023]|uniref:DUF6476 family protein n=1 Tax=unclassified Paracoccus (in: a-proteobacteria) TaxID=2688777 RepID=UPI001C08923E|nr:MULTISPECIES: DUF6476 family protein [unclassified Paracoccus (in: a-proteobacteria)]MBU2958748.1 hypothetical protein [Paracoccus sp. C2R09]MDO6667741.1 DUF6476 family protein [Paracoccus sp. 1_MG-2023]